MRSITTAALLSLAAAAANAAGIVNVTFVEPEKFYDAGNSKQVEPANLKVIEQHFKELGQRYLPDGQVLNISVLDVDLAGYMYPLSPSGTPLRIAQGGADWPRMTLRYSLEANGAPIKSAEEVVADLGYGRHGRLMNPYTDRDPLRLEKQMLDRWFRARFGAEP